MLTLTVVLGDRFALAMLVSMSKSVNSLPDSNFQFLDTLENSISNNFEQYFDDFGDKKKLEAMNEVVKSDPRFSTRLKEIQSNRFYTRTLIDEGVVENIENGALSFAISDQPKSGDFCVAASIKFAVAMLSIRLLQPEVGESMHDWTILAREKFTQFKLAVSEENYKESIRLIESKQPDEPDFIRNQIFLIVRKILEGKFLSSDDFLSMLGNRELIVLDVEN
jgi:hypothetical protein